MVDDQSPVAWWVWPTSAAVLALLLLALWSLQLGRRPPPDPTPHITVEPHADLEPAVSVTSTNSSADVAIRVVPGADVGILTLTEDAP